MIEIEKVLNGIIEKSATKYTPSAVVDYMDQLGYEHNIEINGWQVDFWITFTKDDKEQYMLKGSWFYGDQYFEKL